MKVTLIVAASANAVIGKDNQLLWHLPNDMKFFKRTTWAMPVIMGRKTFESLGNKPLLGRLNLVITRQENCAIKGAVTCSSLPDAIDYAKKEDYDEVFVIGGGEIYQASLPFANQIFLTKVYTDLAGDTYFPKIDETIWKKISEKNFSKDGKHAFDYSFQHWVKSSIPLSESVG